MSVKGQIDRLSQAKTDIVAALKAKGLAVSTDIGLDKTPDLILKLGNATSSPLTGTVDNNIITLAGDLTDGTYALRYYNNGKYIDIGTLTVSGGASTAPDTTLTMTDGVQLSTSTGAESSHASYSASNFVKIVDGYTYILTRTAGKYHRYFSVKVCYYDESKNYLSYEETSIVTSSDSSADETEVTVTIPTVNNAAYFRLRVYNAGLSAAGVFTLTATKE